MHWKKYAILTPPFFLIGVLMAIYLPFGQKHYAILSALVFWAFYYTWFFIEKKKKVTMKKIRLKVSTKKT